MFILIQSFFEARAEIGFFWKLNTKNNFWDFLTFKVTDDIIASGSLLTIGINAAKRSLNEEKHLEFKVTILNLKEEAVLNNLFLMANNTD